MIENSVKKATQLSFLLLLLSAIFNNYTTYFNF